METLFNDLPSAQRQYPSLSDRVQSTFIDSILIVLLMLLFSSVLDRFENAPDWIRIALFVGLWGVYEPLCTTFGCTVGNYIKNIRVRSQKDRGKHINFFQAFARYIVKLALGWISFLTIHSNHEKRAIHDFVAQSVMVKKEA
jgi:uncharacterized RDD family membrane protein YckC